MMYRILICGMVARKKNSIYITENRHKHILSPLVTTLVLIGNMKMSTEK